MAAVASVEDQLRAVVGADHVRPTGSKDTVRGVAAGLVVEPGTEQEVAAILRCANDAGLAVVPRGGGTKLDWGNPPGRADLILSLRRLDAVVEHAWADMTVTVQAGCTVSHLQAVLAQRGQRLAVDPLWPDRATIGGILATNDSGALRLRYGGLRDLIIGATVARADGTLAASGGRVVKNVAGYDLSKLMTGALGTLGVITQATFRIHPRPHATRTYVDFCVLTSLDAQALMLAIQDSSIGHSALQVHGGSLAIYDLEVLLEGTETGIRAQEHELHQLVEEGSVVEPTGAWGWRPGLWDDETIKVILDTENPGVSFETAIAKFTILPADLARILELIGSTARSRHARWEVVVYANGIGWLRLDSPRKEMTALLRELRTEIERSGGSLVVLRQPRDGAHLDAWGSGGDALPLMRALKQQLDPRGTLNPGRFVGGI